MKKINHDVKRHLSAAMTALVFVAALALPNLAFAFAGEDGKACGFMQNITGILNIVSLAVVTVAIIFAGYQVAFAHKRISDVAHILIGGLLIGFGARLGGGCTSGHGICGMASLSGGSLAMVCTGFTVIPGVSMGKMNMVSPRCFGRSVSVRVSKINHFAT